MMVLLVVLMGHESKATAAVTLNSTVSCVQTMLLESIGKRDLLAEGGLEEIASAYAEAVLSSIERISQESVRKGIVWPTERDNGAQAHQSFRREVENQLDRSVYDQFSENLRSRNFILGKIDKFGKAIYQWGGDFALGLALATPILSAIGSSAWFFFHGDFGLAFSLPPGTAAAGVISALVVSKSEDRIHRESRNLSVEFEILVTQKLHEKFKAIVSENHGFSDTTASSLDDSKPMKVKEIMSKAFWYFVVKDLRMPPADGMGADAD